jgi:hypothetical protein
MDLIWSSAGASLILAAVIFSRAEALPLGGVLRRLAAPVDFRIIVFIVLFRFSFRWQRLTNPRRCLRKACESLAIFWPRPDSLQAQTRPPILEQPAPGTANAE